VGQALQAALDIYRDLGDRLGQANALHGLGVVAERTGPYPAAAGALEEALGIYRDLGDRLGQTRFLMRLGQVRLGTADYLGAAASWRWRWTSPVTWAADWTRATRCGAGTRVAANRGLTGRDRCCERLCRLTIRAAARVGPGELTSRLGPFALAVPIGPVLGEVPRAASRSLLGVLASHL
jgi:hypothetical protein